jgi:hypothetical protein
MNLLLSCGFATKKIGFINMFSSAVCWGLWKLKILVPLKMVDGFKGALSSLQKLVGTPEPYNGGLLQEQMPHIVI